MASCLTDRIPDSQTPYHPNKANPAELLRRDEVAPGIPVVAGHVARRRQVGRILRGCQGMHDAEPQRAVAESDRLCLASSHS